MKARVLAARDIMLKREKERELSVGQTYGECAWLVDQALKPPRRRGGKKKKKPSGLDPAA